MSIKKTIDTICYFDIKKSNGGAIFANNLDIYLNSEGTYRSRVFYNNKSTNVHSETMDGFNKKSVLNQSFKDRFKSWIISNSLFELIVHFLKVDLNALTLVLKLRLKNEIKQGDILLFHDFISLFYCSVFFSLKDKKVVMIMHNNGSSSELICAGIKNRIKRNFLRKILDCQMKFCLNDISRIIFLCENAKQNFKHSFLEIKPEICVTIPNGIKDLEFLIAEEKNSEVINFITICTLNVRKGIDLLINCIPEINQKYKTKIKFTIVGQGPLKEDLEALALQHDNLHILGESKEIPRLLNEADVFFLLSRSEGQPLSILEALRASLPIIATDVGCNSSMVSDENGILISPDEKSIVDGFHRMIDEWNISQVKGKVSLNIFTEHFLEEKMYSSYISMFKSL